MSKFIINMPTKFKKLECPVELDAVFELKYDVSGLKKVLAFILENLGDLDGHRSEMAEDIEK